MLLFVQKSFIFQIIYCICAIVGKNVINFISAVGRFCIFLKKISSSCVGGCFFIKNFFNAFVVNGFCSVPIVSLTGLFTGGVLTLQLFISLKIFGINNTIPYIVLLSLMKELAPVLCALTIVSRVGSSMSAEIGSMVIGNQIDALASMSINRYRFLYIPRIFAMTIAQPVLTTVTVIAGVVGSFLVSTRMFGFTDVYFYHLIYDGFVLHAYYTCVVKGAIFGFIISSIACYKGDKTCNGAMGVKNATISTVVMCCVCILVVNFMITWLMG